MTVAGVLDPDATGNYVYDGQYGDTYAYTRDDAAYHIWFDSLAPNWIISVLLGTPGDAWWENDGSRITAPYAPAGTATGDATVTRG